MSRERALALALAVLAAAPAQAADVDRGRQLFSKCVACHSLEKDGPNRVGPRLYGLFGRVSGDVADYRYSDALATARITWTAETLDLYLADTTAMVPGTKMYATMSRPEERAALIAYLAEATAPQGTGCGTASWLPWCR